MIETDKELEKFVKYVIKQSRTNLTKLKKNSSKKLYDSLKGESKLFKNSFGVANVLDYRDRIKFLPKWVTESKGGKGFSELSEVLIRSKSSASNNVNRS
jgi:hypothetical protein